MKTTISVLTSILLFSNFAIAQNDRLEYFPMHIGDEWKYIVFEYDFMTEETSEVIDEVYYKIIGDTLMENGEKYFTFQRHYGENGPLEFNRIDTTTMKVVRYSDFSFSCENKEYDVYNLNAKPDSNWIDCIGQQHLTEFDTSFVNDFGFISPKFTDYPFWGSYMAYNLTKGLGLTLLEIGSRSTTTNEYLVYAKINNKVYNSITTLNTLRTVKGDHFQLHQNYPNPFNSETSIQFSIKLPGFVLLKIFDIAGRKVETLVKEYLSIGDHIVKWDASDFSSGVYLYQLQFKNVNKTKKLLLVK